MREYSDQQREEIIRDYFRPAEGGETPRCPGCGELLHFLPVRSHAGRARIAVRCPECEAGFDWTSRDTSDPWSLLHLEYFLECHQAGRPLRCPFDDARVTCTEFNDGVLEFRCPFCNRRGRSRNPWLTILS